MAFIRGLCLLLAATASYVPSEARAPIPLPIAEISKKSELIVVGRLLSENEWTSGDTDYGKGTIEVEQLLVGIWSESLELTWLNDTRIACPRVSYRHAVGDRRIWFLSWRDDGTVGGITFWASRSLADLPRLLDQLDKVPPEDLLDENVMAVAEFLKRERSLSD